MEQESRTPRPPITSPSQPARPRGMATQARRGWPRHRQRSPACAPPSPVCKRRSPASRNSSRQSNKGWGGKTTNHLWSCTIHSMEERLNKYLAHAGVASRRQCDALIAAGRIMIDGEVVRDLGTHVDPVRQRVAVDGQPIHAERLVYWLVNKPRGVLCTNYDPAGRPLAIHLVPQVSQRVYTVGRLDEASEGLLLLTNDGELANRLMHPRFGIDKTYL